MRSFCIFVGDLISKLLAQIWSDGRGWWTSLLAKTFCQAVKRSDAMLCTVYLLLEIIIRDKPLVSRYLSIFVFSAAKDFSYKYVRYLKYYNMVFLLK